MPYENSEKKISVATAFCPLVSFVRTPRTKKRKPVQKESQTVQIGNTDAQLNKHCVEPSGKEYHLAADAENRYIELKTKIELSRQVRSKSK